MRRFSAFTLTSALIALSCSSSKPPDAEQWAQLTDNQAAIYVGTRYRGLTPKEIRIRRGLDDSGITLRIGNEIVRAFEIERSRRSGTYLPYLSGIERDGDVLVYDLEDLEQLRDSTYTVPHLGVPIKIYDRRYGLTLWVDN